jgi:trehalose-phosphatase
MTPPVKKNSALFLDIDGTLLDMARTPDAVVVPTELQVTLVRLHDVLEGALAFVSGRSLATIDRQRWVVMARKRAVPTASSARSAILSPISCAQFFAT